MKKAAAYVRVSTNEQASEGYSIAAQTEKLTKYIDALGMSLFKVYTDPGYSGSKKERPALNEMVEDIENGLIDTVVVYRLDRLARSQRITLYYIEDIFLKNDVNFISLQENFDTGTAFGRAMIGILSVFAQLELDTITERMLSGRIERAKKGLHRGGGNTPLGYKYENNVLSVNENEAEIVKEVFDRFLHGESQYAIFKSLRPRFPHLMYGANMIPRILSNKTYCGVVTFKEREYEGQHEAIIPLKSYLEVQERLGDTSQKYAVPKNRRSSLLARKIFCSKCGASVTKVKHYHPQTLNSEYSYYVCNSKRKSRPSGIKDPHCKQKNRRTDDVDSQVLDMIQTLDYSAAQKKIKARQQKNIPEQHLKRLADIEKQEKRLLDLYQFGTLEMEELNERLSKLREEKKAIPKPKTHKEDESLIAVLETLKSINWECVTFEELCYFVDQIVHRVEMNDSLLQVKFKF